MAFNHIDIGLSLYLQKKKENGSINPIMTELWPFSFGQFEIFTIGQFRRKPDFQEFLYGKEKMAIYRTFLDQLIQFFGL